MQNKCSVASAQTETSVPNLYWHGFEGGGGQESAAGRPAIPDQHRLRDKLMGGGREQFTLTESHLQIALVELAAGRRSSPGTRRPW